jgi:hypothetical protein
MGGGRVGRLGASPVPTTRSGRFGHEHHQGCDSENSHVVIMRIGRPGHGPSSTAMMQGLSGREDLSGMPRTADPVIHCALCLQH